MRRAWLRLILHGGTFGAVVGLLPLTGFEGDPFGPWLALSVAAGVIAGALATAVLYAFRMSPRMVRRWLAWPVAAGAGGLLFFGSVILLLPPVLHWLGALLPAGIWTLGWLCFLWRPALLAHDTQR